MPEFAKLEWFRSTQGQHNMRCGISKIASMYYPSPSQSSTLPSANGTSYPAKNANYMPWISCDQKEGLHCSYHVLSTLQTPTIAQQ